MAHTIFVSSIRKTLYQPLFWTKSNKNMFSNILKVSIFHKTDAYFVFLFCNFIYNIFYTFIYFRCFIYCWGPHSLVSSKCHFRGEHWGNECWSATQPNLSFSHFHLFAFPPFQTCGTCPLFRTPWLVASSEQLEQVLRNMLFVSRCARQCAESWCLVLLERKNMFPENMFSKNK